MDEGVTITTERVDDMVLLLEMMKRLKLPEILDRHLPRHWLQQGLSWGWVATVWLAHIVSQGDHRKLTVRNWVAQAHTTLEKMTGQEIRTTDFTDDRLTIVLRELSKVDYWTAIERELNRSTIRAYDLETATIRLDATTVSSCHAGGEGSLFQFGHSKDDPTLRQVKLMLATLDPLHLPLVTEVVSGERADDGLYLPAIERIRTTLGRGGGVLFIADCKMSSTEIRATIQTGGDFYLTPLSKVGSVPTELDAWIDAALNGSRERPLIEVCRTEDRERERPLGVGYETTRVCRHEDASGGIREWTERVLVVCSPTYARTLREGLAKRLAAAERRLKALTPPRARGKRQITDEAELIARAEAIVRELKVEGLLSYTFERQVEERKQYVGRGRGGSDRPTRIVEQVRYQIMSVERNPEGIETAMKRLGWRAFVTNAPAETLSFEAAVLAYREEWGIERGFHRLKGAPLSLDPLFVWREDQVRGLIHLMSLALRLLTLIEGVVRRALQPEDASLVGLHPENPKKPTRIPTTERLLRAFKPITLIRGNAPTGSFLYMAPLTPLQLQILALLGFPPNLYSALANST